MNVENFSSPHPLWPAYLTHLERVKMIQWVVDHDCSMLPNTHYLGAVIDQQVVGHIALRVQPITIPATDWSGGQITPLIGPADQPLHETFVRGFAVEESHRRQGYGRALQLAALDLTRDLGCYQMRSWSSLDKAANYALKLSLGFAAHPEIQEAHTGQKISGIYFVKTV